MRGSIPRRSGISLVPAGRQAGGGGAAAAPPAPPAKWTLGRRIVIFVWAALVLAVLIGAAMGDRGYLEVRRRHAEGDALLQEVERLKAEDAALLADVTALRTRPYVIEKLARERLGYARPGEVIYLFPPHETGTNKIVEKGENSPSPTY